MDKAVYGIFLCLFISFPASNGCGTSDSPTTYVLEPGRTVNITSPNYPDDYRDNKVCYWLVQTAPTFKLNYRFIGKFQLDNDCQVYSVTLYDSSNTTNILGSYCGWTRPDPDTTTGSYLLIVRFKSDGYSSSARFNLEITSKKDLCGSSDSPITYVVDSYVYVKSPKYPDNYWKNVTCHWLVVTNPYSKLKFSFVGPFELEAGDQCQYDNVTLYDSSNTTNIIGSYCGWSLPDPGVTTGRYLYISFKSDFNSTYPGFHLYVSSIDYDCGTSNSPATYVLEPGQILHITSPDYPEYYERGDVCYWLVQAATDSKLKYRFIGQFEFERGHYEQPCPDNVTLYDSSNATNAIGTFCEMVPPNPGYTTGRYLYIMFRSVLGDGMGGSPGFNLEITLKDDECSISDSPITYILGSGHTINITSPNYPNNYRENESLYWLVVTAPDSKLMYRFIGQFRLEAGVQCRYDSVTLYDSSNTTNVIRSYCGSSHPLPSITTGRYNGITTGRCLYVSFKSDNRSTYLGFNLEISSTDYECGTHDSPTTYVLDRGQTLSITSPNYPDDYPDNKACNWLVEAAPGSRIKYGFIGKFQVEAGDQCQYDNVTLYDSSNTTNVIGSYCGSTPPNPGVTTGRYLYVSFKSDGRATYPGFVLEITSKDFVCELLESPNTYVLGPGQTIVVTTPTTYYSAMPYSQNVTFNWLVITTPDSKLRYRFFADAFAIDGGDECQNDNVTLYDSSNTTNMIGRYCDSSRPNPGTTTGRYLNVILKSDDVSTALISFKLEIFSKNYECGATDAPITYILDHGQTLNITSPNYPRKYPNDETCHWLIQAAPDSKLKYRFIGQFQIEKDYNDECADNVTLYDSSTTTNIIGSYCGSSPPDPGTTTGRYLYVNFKSGHQRIYSGFILEISPNDDDSTDGLTKTPTRSLSTT